MFGVSTALVSLVDADRQWFKSHVGLDVAETPRDVSFCGHAILSDEIMTVADATKDVRFSENPLVVGSPDIRFYAGCPIVGPGGAKLGTLCIIDQAPRELSTEEAHSLRDLAEMVEFEIASSAMATTDSLTGLGNRRGFEMTATGVIQFNRRQSIDSSLLYFDLDQFKSINDRFGHAEGDKALREFAEILRSVFRLSDVIARLGGDEFAVLLSGTSETDAAVQRLEDSLHSRDAVGGHPYPLKASVGVAIQQWTEDESLALLMNRADVAMYRQKHAE